MKTLKLTLATLAIAAVVSFSASANEAAPAAAPAAAEKSAAKEIELKDGTKVVVEGENVSVLNSDGSKKPAPDGAHETKDGQTINVKEGKVVAQ